MMLLGGSSWTLNLWCHTGKTCGNNNNGRTASRNVVSKTLHHQQWTKLISQHAKSGQAIEALKIYRKMREEGITAGTPTFLAALKACSTIADLESGRDIHAHVIENGYHTDLYIASSLVDMYAKCGSIFDAREVFDKMPEHDVVSWNTLIMGYAHIDMGEQALHLYALMQQEGFSPNARTFVAALKACASVAEREEGMAVDGRVLKLNSLDIGRAIHTQAAKNGVELDRFVASALICMYTKCGIVEDARAVFEKMSHRDYVSWTAMIMGYAQLDMWELALQIYTRMQHDGFAPDARTFVAALKACGSLAAHADEKGVDGELLKLKCLETGRAIHDEVTKSGFESDTFVANTLVAMYTKCRSMVEACLVFEKMQHRDLSSWNAMIMGYAQMEMGEEALKLYAYMQHKGFTPDDRTFVAVLKACGILATQEEGKLVDGKLLKVRCLEIGRTIHAQVAKMGLESDIFVANTLLSMYSKCGSMLDARLVFEKMSRRDMVSWNIMIMGYAQTEMGETALELYACMQHEDCALGNHTFVAVVKACSSLAAQAKGNMTDGKLLKTRCLETVRAIHAEVVNRGFESDVFILSALVDVYSKCGSMVDACQAFEKMPCHDVVSWTAIIMGFAQLEMGDLALQLYVCMQYDGFIPDARCFVAALQACTSLTGQEGDTNFEGQHLKVMCLETGKALHQQIANSGLETDLFVASCLIDMYAKCGSIVDAHQVFEKMPCRNVVSWTAMIMGYAHMDKGEIALQLYARMQLEGCKPNDHTFVAVLMACGSAVSLDTGKEIHAKICRVGREDDVTIANSLLDMYGKCGSMVDAQELFDAMPMKNLSTWNTLIAGYGGQGDSCHVLDLFIRMKHEGIRPDGVTFVSVLTACSHTGLVDKGQEYFHAMSSEFEIIPTIKHYHCMADLLGRAGQLDEVLGLLKGMRLEPDKVTWITILGICKKWNNVKFARHAFECAVSLDEEHVATYILMANIYASANMWVESDKVQDMRYPQAYKKQTSG